MTAGDSDWPDGPAAPSGPDFAGAAQELPGEAGPDGARTRMVAGAAFHGLLSGGLPGMLEAIDTVEADGDGTGIDDPEALRRAEEAVRESSASTGGLENEPRLVPIDEAMMPVASQLKPGLYQGLEDVARSLGSEGIDCGWDPYDPRESVGFTPPGPGTGPNRLFRVVVPASQFDRARECLYGSAPDGVSYPWDVPATAPRAMRPDTVPDARPRPGATLDGAPTGVRDGAPSPQMSDNARLEQMAGGGHSMAWAIAVIIVFLAAAAVLYVVMRP